MSSSSPEDDGDCVVAVKFLGPQLSFCRPDESKPEWTSIKLENPCFHSSRVMFSKKDKVFRILGCEDHLIASCGDISIATTSGTFYSPYYFPPQDVVDN
uniref:DUF295 domain-containing protein n=1 Tax=Brassica campestris TaxID=3711 RepID=M4E1T1_BRACM